MHLFVRLDVPNAVQPGERHELRGVNPRANQPESVVRSEFQDAGSGRESPDERVAHLVQGRDDGTDRLVGKRDDLNRNQAVYG